MKDTQQVLAELSAQLQVTTEHLWHVLVKQQPINSITELLQISISAIISWLAYKVYKRNRSKNEYAEFFESASLFIPLMAFMVFGFIASLSFVFDLDSIYNGFANPEYSALKDILKQLTASN